MQVPNDIRRAVDSVIRERFGNKVQAIEIETGVSDTGEEILLICVGMSPDSTSDDFAGRFFGLTGRVRNALGEGMRGVFPVIRPVEFHA